MVLTFSVLMLCGVVFRSVFSKPCKINSRDTPSALIWESQSWAEVAADSVTRQSPRPAERFLRKTYTQYTNTKAYTVFNLCCYAKQTQSNTEVTNRQVWQSSTELQMFACHIVSLIFAKLNHSFPNRVCFSCVDTAPVNILLCIDFN